jgi:hypothetical protein
MLDIGKAVEELRWAKDHGACGVFKKGIEAGGRAASDPHFFPIYEEASRLNLPICIHNANGFIESATTEGTGLGGGMIAIAAFNALAEHGIPDMFPKLRVGFIETGASWVQWPQAALAVDVYVYRVRRQVGARGAALDGVDALGFTGGVGETSAAIRDRVGRHPVLLRVPLGASANRAGRPRLGHAAQVFVESPRADVVPEDRDHQRRRALGSQRSGSVRHQPRPEALAL